MKRSPIIGNEEARLKSLADLEILDSLEEAEFNHIVSLAALICHTPISLVSFVDQTRQWFKAKIGIDIQQTSREVAFCSHTIQQPHVLVVPDATQDERFRTNPLVTGHPNIRFYAGAPILSPDGYPIGTVCVVDTQPRKIDESQIKALEFLSLQVNKLLQLKVEIKKLKESEEKLRFKSIALDNLSEGVVLQDAMGQIIDFNPAALVVLGLTQNQLLGKTSLDSDWNSIREDESDFPGNEHPAMVCLKTGEPVREVVMGIRRGLGGPKWIRINSVPLNQNKQQLPTHAVTSFTDITNLRKLELKRRDLELQLAESAKLSALGEMAGGISHEINNPLAIIKGKANLSRKKIGLNPIPTNIIEKELVEIENTVDRIAKIIKGLRTYSRDSEKDPFQFCKVTTIIEDSLALVKEKFKYFEIKIFVTCDANIEINCRPTQISQVLVNLLSNSFDAISPLSEKWIKIEVERDEERIILRFQDSGLGIEPAVVKKMMHPFYTTKPVGKGTGLGLSISSSIIEDHGGKFEYDPTASHTTFKLTFMNNGLFNNQKAS